MKNTVRKYLPTLLSGLYWGQPEIHENIVEAVKIKKLENQVIRFTGDFIVFSHYMPLNFTH